MNFLIGCEGTWELKGFLFCVLQKSTISGGWITLAKQIFWSNFFKLGFVLKWLQNQKVAEKEKERENEMREAKRGKRTKGEELKCVWEPF